MRKSDTMVVAVTGGMGSGQSTVCQYLEKFGAKVINADRVAKLEIDRNKELQEDLKKAFGSKIFYRGGRLNRNLLAGIAFSNEAKTWRLNRLVHPHMVAKIIDIIERTRESRKYPLIAVDAALIYEMNLENMFDAVVVVSSIIIKRIDRIKLRDKLTEKAILERIAKQIPLDEKMKWGDYVIENNGSLQELEKRTRELYYKLTGKVKRGARASKG
jgi:dephospho-CoA kinase